MTTLSRWRAGSPSLHPGVLWSQGSRARGLVGSKAASPCCFGESHLAWLVTHTDMLPRGAWVLSWLRSPRELPACLGTRLGTTRPRVSAGLSTRPRARAVRLSGLLCFSDKSWGLGLYSGAPDEKD